MLNDRDHVSGLAEVDEEEFPVGSWILMDELYDCLLIATRRRKDFAESAATNLVALESTRARA